MQEMSKEVVQAERITHMTIIAQKGAAGHAKRLDYVH